jgi:hypothetical protein
LGDSVFVYDTTNNKLGVGVQQPKNELHILKGVDGGDVSLRITNQSSVDAGTSASMYLGTSPSDTFNTFYIRTYRDGGATHLGYSNPDDANHDPNIILPSAGGLEFGTQTNATSTTSVATVLDHYEEGLFTPTLVGSTGGEATYGNQKGGYVRIGNLVHIYGYLSITNVNTITGTLRLGNFPFSTRSDSNYFHAPSMGWYTNITGITAHGLGLDIAAGANSGAIVYGNGTGVTGLNVANVNNNFSCEWAFTYRTND